MKKIICLLICLILAALSAAAAASEYRTEWNGHAYELIFTKMPYEHAEAYCESLGGHLLTITSAKEQKTIEKLMKMPAARDRQRAYWLGANLARWTDPWTTWITGEKMTYFNWDRNQPDRWFSNETHIVIAGKTTTDDGGWTFYFGKWDDCSYADDALPFICEWEEIDSRLVTSIKLNKKEATLKKGKTLRLKVKKILPADADNKKVYWETSNPAVATVTTAGKVKAVGKGFCIITCTAADGSGVSAACEITVK